MKRAFSILPVCLLAVLLTCSVSMAADGVIKIGFNMPFSGMFAVDGAHSKNAAELVRKEVEAAGGLKVGAKTYSLDFIYGDNMSNATSASALAVNQITQNQILGIVGPLSSQQAIPVAQMAESFKTPMISPWSTSPLTTLDRPFVFRSCFVYTAQGPVLTQFAAKEFHATKGAALFNVLNPYSRGLAKSFKKAFENVNGPGSITAFEEFRTGDQDFRKQLREIKKSGAQVMFSPQHDSEVALIVKQAKEIGLNIPILGSNSWAGGDLPGKCGPDCNGLYFTGNYAAGGATGINKRFVTAYEDAYKQIPDEPAALTWDATRALLAAIQNTGNLTGNLLTDRVAVKNALVNLKNFDGATGKMSFNASGNPSKCTLVIEIKDGKFTSHSAFCPKGE